MNLKLVSKVLFLAGVGSFLTSGALAQWQWLDKDGHKVFSDRAPPSEITDKNILKRPVGSPKPAPAPQQPIDASAGSTKTATSTSAPVSRASTPKLTGKDADLEARKKKAEDEETARKKAEEDKIAKVKADNCERAKASMATLQSGIRLSSINANGEREIYDDTKRATETKRSQELLDSTCK